MLTARERLLRNLDWNLLYTFITIVEEGSITGAARKLSLSQPSISNALKRFETHLGVALIVRRKGEFSLTYQGLQVYEYISSANNILSHLADQFSDTEDALQGELEIKIASHICSTSIDQALARYNELYPNVLICIDTQPSAEIVNSVAESRLNIGISNKKISQTGLRFDLIGYEELGFYCGAKHELFGKEDIPISDLSGYPYVSFESDQPGEGLSAIAQIRSEQSFWGKLAAISSNEEEVRRLILAGVGFGTLSVEGAKLFVDQGLLWQLPPYENLPFAHIYLTTPENSPLSEVEMRFISILREEVSNNIRDAHFPPN